MRRCFFTVDLEDFYQLQHYQLHGQIVSVDDSFANALDEILQLLRRNQIKATFFILGVIAKSNPDVLIRIMEDGHEIGSHGMYHLNYRDVAEEVWMNDVQESKYLIESVLNKKIVGFRAPFFAAPCNYQKYLEFLSSQGFLYDSSYHVSPFLKISISELDSGFSFPVEKLKIMELTPSYYSNRIRLPLYGGSYFRIIPTFVLSYLLNCHKENLVFYMHPYEIYKTPLIFVNNSSSIFVNIKAKIRTIFYNYNRKNFMDKVLHLSKSKYKFETIEKFYYECINT